MEARESSGPSPSPAPSASSSAAIRDGTSPAENDAVLSVNSALAKDAALHFQAAKYAECVEVLDTLLEKKPNDPKVLHNITIAKYFRDGFSDPKRLLNILYDVKKRSEEIAQASAEQLETGGNVGNKVVSGSKGSNTSTPQLPADSSYSPIYMDEYDSFVAILNIATLWFHLHEYTKALSVLEPLFQNIEPMDEAIARNVCLLFLDAALACNDVTKSADALLYLEKDFGVSCAFQGDNGTSAQQQPNLVGKSTSLPNNSLSSDASELSANNASEKEKTLSRTQSDEILDYEPFSLDMDVARSTGISASNDLFKSAVDRSTSADLKLKFQLYKIRFLLLTRNLKQAKREVKHAMNIARGGDSSMALLLKSQFEYARGNYRKALRLMVASPNNRSDLGSLITLQNNLGCIYYQLGKYHTSSVLFSTALTYCSSLRKDKPKNLATFSQDNSLLIIYNCGMQYLTCGKPLLAARCFQKAGLIFYNQPLLWLRIAECCLMAIEKGLIRTNPVPMRNGVRICVAGKGKWRQLILENGVLKNGNSADLGRVDLSLGSDQQPHLSLFLARQCLYNALDLMNHSETSYLKLGLPSNSFFNETESTEIAPSKNPNQKSLLNMDAKVNAISAGISQFSLNGDSKEQKGATTQEIVQNSLSCYEDLRKKDSILIKQALLANLSYVELELGDPVKALAKARSLLDFPECSRVYLFLARIFAAEALCLLNRQKEAIEHLSRYLSEGNVGLPFSQEDWDQCQMKGISDCEESNTVAANAKNSSTPPPNEGIAFLSPEEARGTVYANFAVLFAIQGELEQAYRFASQALLITPNSLQATLTAVYINLMLGKSQDAIVMLKQCSRVAFYSSGLTLNKSPSLS